MSREIKFRMWDKNGSVMRYEENRIFITLDGRPHFWTGDNVLIQGKFWDNQNTPLMQFTGLKDKNDKEIYEGDILKGFDSLFIIKWGVIRRTVVNNFRNLSNVDIPCFHFENLNGEKLFPIVDNYKGEHDLQTLEVIGNIHENPELLS